MPTFDSIAPLISGAAESLYNAYSQQDINTQGRGYNMEMYALQRKHALADWNMMNEYNSPIEQMKRLKAAGLNPNLVYGNGATATSSSQPRASTVLPWSPKAPEMRMDLGQTLATIAGTALTKQNTATAKSVEDLNRTNAIKSAAETAKIYSETATTDWQRYMSKSLWTNTQEVAQANLDKLNAEISNIKTNTSYTLDKNEREIAMNNSNIKEAVARIALMNEQRGKIPLEKQEIEKRLLLLESDTNIKNEDLRLKRMGIQPHDPAWTRAVQEIYSTVFGSDGAYSNMTRGIGSGYDIEVRPGKVAH